jgi:hypothetical protein
MSCEYSRFVRDKATSGMSSDQIAGALHSEAGVPYELAKKYITEPEYKEEIEAGHLYGLGKIWERLYHLAFKQDDYAILLLLAKEQLKLFGKVDSEELMAKSSLSKDKLKKIHDILFTNN